MHNFVPCVRMVWREGPRISPDRPVACVLPNERAMLPLMKTDAATETASLPDNGRARKAGHFNKKSWTDDTDPRTSH